MPSSSQNDPRRVLLSTTVPPPAISTQQDRYARTVSSRIMLQLPLSKFRNSIVPFPTGSWPVVVRTRRSSATKFIPTRMRPPRRSASVGRVPARYRSTFLHFDGRQFRVGGSAPRPIEFGGHIRCILIVSTATHPQSYRHRQHTASGSRCTQHDAHGMMSSHYTWHQSVKFRVGGCDHCVEGI